MSDFFKQRVSKVTSNTNLKPKIGLTGSFGRGNYGDELYLQNYEYWFGEFADLFLLSGLPRKSYLRRFSWNLVDMMDAVVLGGGDLLVPHRFPIDADFVDPAYRRKPLHIACIGVQRTTKDQDPRVIERWKKVLKHQNIRTISTRDSGSAEWIEDYIKPNLPISSHPDMICALPLPDTSKPEGAPVLGIITRHVADPKQYVQLEKIGKKLIDQGWIVHHIIGGVGGHGKKDFENAKFLNIPGKEVIYSEDLDDISRALGACSLVLSFKLHTTLVSVMYGVPTICVNPVVKAKAFMKSVGLEHLVFSATDLKLSEMIEKGVPDAPDPLKVEKLKLEASSFMRSLGLKIYEDFYKKNSNKSLLLEQPVFPK